ncbi:MAG: hypothetical protein JSU77_02975 [Fidelibacterota bacterium]|nr:MAG: hypothetical protein JSU77_02975 [Candidatus Neomarinimicrobiota bacterium]
MRKTSLILFSLMPAMALAQVELGSFVFLDGSRAAHITGNLGLGGSGAYAMGLSREAPAPKVLEFMNFVPGYAIKYTVAYTGDLLIHGSMITRARYQPRRKMIGVFGIGIGAKIGKDFTPYPNLVLGVDYLLNDKYIITAALESGGMLTIGFGLHKHYGW